MIRLKIIGFGSVLFWFRRNRCGMIGFGRTLICFLSIRFGMIGFRTLALVSEYLVLDLF